ncbi:MAG: hypothetical protein KGI67_09000, partial [Pseudomonadota bacterium]|nr:hypothetical protein [Pseudomonadota bacterium]
MSPDPDRLFRLLPAIHQQRDAETGGALQALLGVIGEQVDRVDADIDQLYRNWFIETCEDWAVPYLGALIGYRVATPASLPATLDDDSARLLEQALVPRREVANTITARLRRGSLSGLAAQVADLSGWRVRAEEWAPRLAVTQVPDHARPQRGRSVDLRVRRALARLDTAFDDSSRSVQLRAADALQAGDSEAVERVRLHLWRLGVHLHERVPAHCLDHDDGRCFRFDVLGLDVPLQARPDTVDDDTVLPGAITRLALTRESRHGHRSRLRTSPALYGAGRSLAVWAPGWEHAAADAPIAVERIVVADLGDWSFEPPLGHVAVDPERGRLSFPPGQLPDDGVWVSYCSASPAQLGAGPWPRALAYPAQTACWRVGVGMQFASVGAALEHWRHAAPASAIIEIVDSEVYPETLHIRIGAGQHLVLRAASGARPLIRPAARRGNRPDAFAVEGAAGSVLELQGLMLHGRSLEVSGELVLLRIADCTLLPQRDLRHEAGVEASLAPSLVLLDTAVRLEIVRSLCGALRTLRTRPDLAPGACRIEDSVLDGGDADEGVAVSGEEARLAALELTLRRCTVFGCLHLHALALAENSLLLGEVKVARRQQGCLRCCYVAPGSHTPARHLCQPDLTEHTLA